MGCLQKIKISLLFILAFIATIGIIHSINPKHNVWMQIQSKTFQFDHEFNYFFYANSTQSTRSHSLFEWVWVRTFSEKAHIAHPGLALAKPNLKIYI